MFSHFVIVQILMHHNFTTKQFNLSIYISAVLFEHLGFNVIYIFYLYINVLVAVFVLFIQNRHDFYVSLFVFSDLKISTMREEEKALRQKLSEMEKAKKQLQCDLASRDRTIQQLRAVSSGRSVCLTMPFFLFHFLHLPQEQSSDTKSEQTLHLYQKACKGMSVLVCPMFLLIE